MAKTLPHAKIWLKSVWTVEHCTYDKQQTHIIPTCFASGKLKTHISAKHNDFLTHHINFITPRISEKVKNKNARLFLSHFFKLNLILKYIEDLLALKNLFLDKL